MPSIAQVSPAALEHMDVPVRRSGVPVAPGARNGRICGVGIRLETIAYQMYAHAFAVKNALLSLRSRTWMCECRMRRERNSACDGETFR